MYELFFAGGSDCLECCGDAFAACWSMWSAARRAGEGDLQIWWGAERREQWESLLLINTACSSQKEAIFSAVLDGSMCWFLCVLLSTALHGCIWQNERRAALPAAQEVRALLSALPSLALTRTVLLTTSLPLENWLTLGRVIPRSLSLGNWYL